MSTKNQVPPIPEDRLRASFFSKLFLKGKVYMINPDFQWKFMSYVILTVVMSVGIIFLTNYIFFEDLIAQGEKYGLPKDHGYFVMIKHQRNTMTGIFFGVSAVISIIIGFWGLFFSHRIAGPLYRLNLYFRKAAIDKDTKIPPLFFRENDFFQEVPDSINTYLKATGQLFDEDDEDEISHDDIHDDENPDLPPISDLGDDEEKKAS